MYRQQTKRHIKTDLIETCISMYRDNVRNIHARECQGIHARTEHGGGSSERPEPKIDPSLLIHVC